MFIIRYDGIRIAYLQSLILLREFFELKKLWKNLKYLFIKSCYYNVSVSIDIFVEHGFSKKKKKITILKLIQE